MSSPLDPNEVEALMQAIQEGRVSPEPGAEAGGPVVPYDLTSQDRIIRGQMPTLDSINDRIASLFGRSLAARTRMDVRATSTPATLMKFSDVTALMTARTTVGVMSLGAGHGMALLIVEGELAQALLCGALGDRKARPAAPASPDARPELTNVERLLLKHLLGMLGDAMGVGWAEVLSFKPELLRFESDPRMTIIARPSDVVIVCSFEITGALDGRLQIAIPYAAVESAKKLLTSPPRLGGQRDARFSHALATELEGVEVELRVEIGHRKISVSELLQLQIGDVLTLNTSETAPLPVFVQGRPKMLASPRVAGGGMAVEILRNLSGASGRAGRGAPGAYHGGSS